MNDMLRRAAIVGVYATEQGHLPHRTEFDLQLEAIKGVLDDCGLKKGDIDGIQGPFIGHTAAAVSAAFWAEQFGHQITYSGATDSVGAAPVGDVLHAIGAVAMGLCDTVLMLQGSATAAAEASASRDGHVADLAFKHGEFDAGWGSITAGWHAFIAQRHMHEFGTTREQLAAVGVADRAWAVMNPEAQMHKRGPITIQDVINSKPITEPLHLLDCCLISHGYAAILITTPERARDCRKKPVWVLGGGEAYDHFGYVNTAHSYTRSSAVESGKKAFEMSGVSHKDLDTLQIMDCFSIVAIRELEDLGFCSKGEGGAFVQDGKLGPGGTLPTNTDGGSLSYSHAHPGSSRIIEATRQLRGESGPRQVKEAKLALVHNQGGPLAVNSTMIMGRD